MFEFLDRHYLFASYTIKLLIVQIKHTFLSPPNSHQGGIGTLLCQASVNDGWIPMNKNLWQVPL